MTIYISKGDSDQMTWELCQDVIAAGFIPQIVMAKQAIAKVAK